MIRSTIGVMIPLIAVLFAVLWTPTQADLDRALAEARAAWRADVPAAVALGPLGGCEFHRKPYPSVSGGEWEETDVRLGWTEPVERTETTEEDDEVEVSVSRSYRITVNNACDWRAFPLAKVVLHEYGHALGRGHSLNKRSIMYHIVFQDREQSILPEDRP